jgi:predicted cupin superfamily sugar epimerase
MRLMWIDTDGIRQEVLVGPAEMDGALLQVLVPQGCYMAAESTGSWSLVACTMAPAFHEDDFKLCRQADLLGLFPQYSEWITRFTRH